MRRKKIAALGLVVALTVSSSSAVWAASLPQTQRPVVVTDTAETQDTENTDEAQQPAEDVTNDADANQTETVSDASDAENGTGTVEEDQNTTDNTVTDAAAGIDAQISSSDTTTVGTEDTADVANVPNDSTMLQESEDEVSLQEAQIMVMAAVSTPSSIGGVATTDIINTAKVMIRKYEGTYNSVNPNDNGALSIGKMQWHANRAKSLLQSIIAGDGTAAKQILGDALYNEILAGNISWSNRTLNNDETAKIKSLLSTNQSQMAQDSQEDTDVTAYINDIYNRGIRNAAAVAYLADVENQAGSGGVNTILSYAKNLGNLSDLTLNEIHIATVCYAYMNRNTWLAKSDANRKSFITRRINAYVDASGAGWTYCKSGDYRMPSTSPRTNKIGIQWLQKALNEYQGAGLELDGSYGPATQAAVKAFQQSAGLTADGDCGVDTTRELIRRLYFNKVYTRSSDIIGRDVTDIVQDANGNWIYTVNGKQDVSYTGFAENVMGWWYVEKGQVTFRANGFIQGTVKGAAGWWYVEGSQVTFSTNDIIQGTVNGEDSWWNVRGSQVIFSDTVANNAGGWWRIKNGKVDFDYNGITNNQNGWWYIRDGEVKFDYTGVSNNENGWWRVENGQVNFNYNGITNNQNGWWYIRGGQVKFDYTGVSNNENGWWRVENGKVNFNFNGIANNENGWWYMKGGKVDFNYNGTIHVKGKAYTVKNGKVDV